jgi:hypothetical protein
VKYAWKTKRQQLKHFASNLSSMGRALVASVFVAGALLCADALGAANGVVVSTKPTASIWFHPLPPGGNGGSMDFGRLFNSDSPWPLAMKHTAVFGMYAGWIADVSDPELQAAVAFLNAHNMAIEIEAPSLQAQANCGSGVEGYVPFGQSLHDFTLAYLQRLKALNANVAFIKVDEPFFFGSIVNDPRSCHFSVEEVALQVGQYRQLVHTVYPNTAVGDVEPIIDGAYPGGVVAAMGEWHQAYKVIAGAEFPFFFADIDFSNPAWPQLVRQLEQQTREFAMKFGIIYIGDPQDVSDAEWSEKVVHRFQVYQGAAGGRPDYVLFQSWEVHPKHCLPETKPYTFTGVLDSYIQWAK